MFPKPGKRKPQSVFIHRDGREVLNLNTGEGKREYRSRVEAMRIRQGGECCLYGWCPDCPRYLSTETATFEHEGGRGMGGSKRDDRVSLPDGTWLNGAAHASCNCWKSSRYIPYNCTLQRHSLPAATASQEDSHG